jgi:sugar/nucleoside kinase (ribokinase family)
VETTTGKAENQLGGSAIYFSLASSFLNPVRLVGVVGEDFPSGYLKIFENRDVDYTGLEVRKGSRTFRWHGRYSEDMNYRDTVSVELNVLAERGPKIPQRFQDSEYIFLANSDPVLQMELLNQLTSPKFVVCDTMDLWIDHHRDNLKKLLSKVNGIILNDSESAALTGKRNILSAAREVSRMGPKLVVIKKGEHGAMLFHEESLFLTPAYPTEKVIDPTGAGDCFAGGFMGKLADMNRLDLRSFAQALISGTVVASFAVEGFSMNGLETITRSDIEHRQKKFLKMTGTNIEN